MNGKCAPDIHDAVHADISLVHLDVFFCNRERKPDTFVLLFRSSLIGFLEWFKDLIQLGIRNTETIVLDGEAVQFVKGGSLVPDPDLPWRGRVIHRIGKHRV